MARITVQVTMCIQDSQEFGSDDEHMVSRVFYSLAVDGVEKGDFHSDIKQTVGSEIGMIEVYPPVGYNGPLDYQKFRDKIADYYNSLVGPGGSAIGLGPSAKNIRMRNNTIRKPHRFELEV